MAQQFQLRLETPSDQPARITISGKIVEDFPPEAVAAQIFALVPSGPLQLDLGAVTMLNSVGISSWLKLIMTLERDHSLLFTVLSSVFVDACSILPNLLGRVENPIGALNLPVHCKSCDQRISIPTEASLLSDSSGNFRMPELPCPTCNKPVEFDAYEDDYSSFFRNRRTWARAGREQT